MLAVAGLILALVPVAQTAYISSPGGFPAPAGLIPGDTYRLVFVTSTTRNATSTDIADHNAFVQGRANAGGIGSTVGMEWKALASTLAPTWTQSTDIGNAELAYRSDGTLVGGGTTGDSARKRVNDHVEKAESLMYRIGVDF